MTRSAALLCVFLAFALSAASCSEPGERLTVSPHSASVAAGERVTFVAELTLAAGEKRDVTAEVSWSVDSDALRQTATAGVLVADSPGIASVSASFGGSTAYALIGVRPRAAMPPLEVSNDIPRYFVDANGEPVFLAGAHTWSNFQDNAQSFPPSHFDYDEYLDVLERNNHNFFRLWRWEQGAWMTEIDGEYWFVPQPYVRTGPGTALDGRPKYDLNEFDDEYFDRLRDRVRAAGDRRMFVSVMLFDGWSVEPKGARLGNPWDGHALNAANNINGIDGDLDSDGRGNETHTLQSPEVLAVQEAYVRRVYEAVGDLDNVLFEISNESAGGSAAWQYHMIELVHALARERGSSALVGMTVERPMPSNDALFRSPADWISPFRDSDDPLDPGPHYSSKVMMHDTDHLCGTCGTVPWVWRAMTRGYNLLLMDFYDTTPTSIGRSSMHMADNDWESVRRNMGYARVIADQINLTRAEPLGGLVSTGYGLANTSESPHQYAIYVPADRLRVTVDLRASPAMLSVAWVSTETGMLIREAPVQGGQRVVLEPPISGDKVLWLVEADESGNAGP